MRIVLAAMILAAVAGCSRKHDDRSITAAPEHSPTSAASSVAVTRSLAPSPSAVPVANPLAMPLKHDGPAPAASLTAVDPCARLPETGPLGMPLKHDGPAKPQQPNPLCMRLK